MAAFDEAQQQTDASKRQALAALAEGGSAGLADYKAAQQQLASQKADAAKMALARAAAINAPEAGAELAAHGSLTGRPEAAYVPPAGAIYDRYSTDSQRAATARQQAMADINAANSSYFEQVNAARPIAEAAAAQALAAKKAKEAEFNPIVEALKSVGGIGAARALANDGLEPEAQRQASDFSERRGANGPGSAPRTIDEIRDERLRGRTEDLGLPSWYASALRVAPKGPTASEARDAHRADVVTRAQQHASPGTVDALHRTIAASGSLAEALSNLADTPDDDYQAEDKNHVPLVDKDGRPVMIQGLRSRGVSRSALTNWIRDYYSAPGSATPNGVAAEEPSVAARLRLLVAARRAASPGTYRELEKAIDIGEAAQDIQPALDYIAGLHDDYLKRNGISRAALVDWVRRYGDE